jgi:hypothetical protein
VTPLVPFPSIEVTPGYPYPVEPSFVPDDGTVEIDVGNLYNDGGSYDDGSDDDGGSYDDGGGYGDGGSDGGGAEAAY